MRGVAEEVFDFSIFDGVVVGGIKTVGPVRNDVVVTVVFGGVDGVVGAPLDDEASRLQEGLLIRDAQSVNALDRCIRQRERRPIMPRETLSTG